MFSDIAPGSNAMIGLTASAHCLPAVLEKLTSLNAVLLDAELSRRPRSPGQEHPNARWYGVV